MGIKEEHDLKWVKYRMFNLKFQKPNNRCSPPEVFLGKVFWKYAANLQETTHAKVRFHQSFFATLLKSHFGMGVIP